MKKFLLCVLALMLFASSGWAAMTTSIGKDKNGDVWYSVGSGRDSNGKRWAVARQYHANQKLKKSEINALKGYGVASATAESLYFSERKYQYTTHGKKYALVEVNYYDMLGNKIYDKIYADNEKQYINLTSSSAEYGAVHCVGEAFWDASDLLNSSETDDNETNTGGGNSGRIRATPEKLDNRKVPAKPRLRPTPKK